MFTSDIQSPALSRYILTEILKKYAPVLPQHLWIADWLLRAVSECIPGDCWVLHRWSWIQRTSPTTDWNHNLKLPTHFTTCLYSCRARLANWPLTHADTKNPLHSYQRFRGRHLSGAPAQHLLIFIYHRRARRFRCWTREWTEPQLIWMHGWAQVWARQDSRPRIWVCDRLVCLSWKDDAQDVWGNLP